jgi:hypothetical protein
VRIAYLMVVHRDPEVLKRAITTLSWGECAFFVHIDRKADGRKFSGALGHDVFASSLRLPVYWGEFSQVKAATLLMEKALAHAEPCDYFVLLTGSTYPLRSGRYVHAFLEQNLGFEFMSMVKMPAPGKPISRINTVRFPSHKPLRRFAARALARLGIAQRDHRRCLGALQPYSGVASWALSRAACEYVLGFLARNPHVEAYFQNTFAPDEMLFHTVLGNSPFRDHMRRDLLYDNWSVPGPHPATINAQHVSFFEAQEKVWVEDMYGSGEALFARKFSDDRLDLLDRVDKMIRRKEAYLLGS